MTADQKVRLMCVLQAGRYDAVRAKVTISPAVPPGFPDTPDVHVDWYDPDNTVANVPATAPENDGQGVRDNLSSVSVETPTLEFGSSDKHGKIRSRARSDAWGRGRRG
ncbi:MAG: hypothetical protein KJZ87_10860 [Thermoguttaceae bacterium]|nr:hypothetical protein [Thermoguttaceae bacterium]